ncbi:FxsA family protein [Haliea sp. AH-315-K21]|uniref:Biotin--acetyl-CoA-carboxylase ligase n=1 Tax=SAR86 cluster bacterium TaxID=2030880 RepID=A0A2A5CAB5_9GAMM|nr:FxsA family protein [Haliea sp. AH-315-K21]PCJ40693.1 MAG: biotin--acetyl-CoA-carboxylase ligase [SAR86 cluster bacterium]
MRYLFLLFILIPIAEMLLLFEVADHIGAWSTLALVVLTAVVGIQILKQQGLATFTRASQKMSSGELPAQEMIEGIFLAVGGAFLLTPGFITDTLGFMFLIGPIRRLFVRALIKSGKLAMWKAGGQQQFFYTNYQTRSKSEEGGIYEGEFEREEPIKPDQDKLGKE